MIDPKITIDTIANWNLVHPKPVQNILDAYQVMNDAQTKAPSWEGITDPKKIVATIQAQTQHALTTGEAADQAVRTARFKISTALTEEVSEHLEDYLEQLEPAFNKAAEVYEQAVVKLPKEFAANSVVTFEPDQFQAYTDAKAAATQIQSARAWALSLSGLIPGQSYNNQYSNEFLVLDPRGVAGYATIQLADTKGHDPAYSAISPVLAKAVKAGGVLRLALPDEAREDIEDYESQRQEMNQVEWNKIRKGLVL